MSDKAEGVNGIQTPFEFGLDVVRRMTLTEDPDLSAEARNTVNEDIETNVYRTKIKHYKFKLFKMRKPG